MFILAKELCKPKIINLNDYGIRLMEIMQSGQTVTKIDSGRFLNDAWKAFQSGRIPIAHDESSSLWIVPSGLNSGQFTGSIVGAMGGSGVRQYVSANLVILHDEVALFTAMLN